MSTYDSLNTTELQELLAHKQNEYDQYKARKLNLNMARGKPAPEQLDLTTDLFTAVSLETGFIAADGTDVRNYGGLDGIPEAKRLFADLLGVREQDVLIGGNSSLNIMYDTVVRALLFGLTASTKPWRDYPEVKFICPSPGYDRHFAICEKLNIQMIPVDMLEDGPDMDQVERLVREDESIKGMWCVPRYSNPDGITYADTVVDRLAKMKTKAADFTIFWDDAYVVHHLTDTPDQLKNMLHACEQAGQPDRVFIFASTSKITFPGAGISAVVASAKNLNFMREHLAIQTIGPDKINQLRHVRFLKNANSVREHMRQHADLIRPKFDLVLRTLEEQLGSYEIATWHKPNGGYFISLNTVDGCAQKVVRLAAEAGVTLTKAGATFPYGKDPRDRNIRIAPTFPSQEELQNAMNVLCLCVHIATLEKLLSTSA